MAFQGVHPCIGVLQGNNPLSLFSLSSLLSSISLFLMRYLSRHHQHGRWQARIGRVAGNKDLYLGTFSKSFSKSLFMPMHYVLLLLYIFNMQFKRHFKRYSIHIQAIISPTLIRNTATVTL